MKKFTFTLIFLVFALFVTAQKLTPVKNLKGQYGYENDAKQLVIPANWEMAHPFEGNFARVKKNKQWAFINQQGKKISAWYDTIYDYKFGIALVRLRNKFGAIDKNGTIKIPLKYDSKDIELTLNQYIADFVKDNPNDKESIAHINTLKKEEEERIKTEEIEKKQTEAKEYFEKANSFYFDAKYTEALSMYLKVIELDPNDQFANGQLSFVYFALKQYENAYENSKNLTELDSTDFRNFFSLSYFALFAGKAEEAKKAALKSLELAPDKPGVNSNLACAYILNNEFEKANAIYVKLKDEYFSDVSQLAKEVFLQDIKDLEDAGITHGDFAKVKKLLTK